MNKSLIVLSGGMDSTTLLHQRKSEIKLAVSFNYGSKHNGREIEHALNSCNSLEIKHIEVNLRDAMQHFKSNLLLGGGDIPEGHYADDNMAKTVVPFRNGIMLSIAAGIAESNELDTILIANHFGDSAQYPDCRQEFIVPMQETIFKGTGYKVVLEAPFTDISKRDIALIGDDLHIDWSTTYSCYKGGEHHCGKCGTCVERIWALKDLRDDTVYEEYSYAVGVLKEAGEW